MRRPKAAVAAHSALDPKQMARENALMRELYATERDACMTSAKAYTAATITHLRARTPEEQAGFVKDMVEGAQSFFQPWTVEIMFVLGILGRARFTELQRLLGLSSRTLSDKLQALRDAELLDRRVFDEQPVRIEYFLTRRGKRVATLATPLFCEMGQMDAGGAK